MRRSPSIAAPCVVAVAVIFAQVSLVTGQTRLCENYTRTLDGGECTAQDTVCEFKLVVGHKLTLTKDDGTGLFVDNYGIYRVRGQTPLSEDDLRDVVVADGAFPERLVTVVNGTMPGPCLTIFKNQRVIVHVINDLTSESLSIHWHGLDMFKNTFMDGVAFVSQCPIQPGDSFKYSFSAGMQPGTYWYHSHLGAQRSMGILGPLIVLERDDVVLPHNERVMVLQDWNHDFTSDHMELGTFEFVNGEQLKKRGPTESLDTAGFSSFPFQSGLINGRGRYYEKNSPVMVKFKTPLEVFEVEKGEMYRFRVIGAGVIYPYRVSVQGHRIQVVASDGHDFQPISAESFVINPGERFDFILTANQTTGNYMIFAETLETDLTVRHVAEAILHYSGSSGWTNLLTQQPYLPINGQARGCTAARKCTVVNCPFSYYPMGDHTECVHLGDLKDVSATGAPRDSASEIKEVFLNFGFPGHTRTPASINGIKFERPPVAAALYPDTMPRRCETCGENKTCSCTHTVTLKRDRVHQIVLLNLGSGKGFSHPVHIHGYSFYVVKMGYPPYDSTNGHLTGDNEDVECVDEFCNVAQWRNQSWVGDEVPDLNLVNPIRKDTIIVPTGGYVVLRLRANNPGMWFVHCHIELHHLDGMALILDGSEGGLGKPPKGFPDCDNFPRTQANSSISGRLMYHSVLCIFLLVCIAVFI